MDGIRVEWTRLPRWLAPAAVRDAVEARLVLLWLFLDCSRQAKRGDNERAESEEFRIDEDHWSFTYKIDLRVGAAIVNNAIELAC